MQASRDESLKWLRRGKCPVAIVTGASAVSGDDAEMIRGARSQTADVRTEILVRVAGLGLRGSCVSVAARYSVLKVNARGQSVRIDRAIERR